MFNFNVLYFSISCLFLMRYQRQCEFSKAIVNAIDMRQNKKEGGVRRGQSICTDILISKFPFLQPDGVNL